MAIANKNLIFRTFGYVLAFTAIVLMAACGPSKNSLSGTGDSATAPTAEIADDYDGDGMEIPLDGTSLAAFDASMARVERHTSASNYKTLENAIEYLLVYDIAARGNKEKLVAKLNGLNGYQVIDKVGWRKPAPGKGKVEKDAADAKIIDS
jgi:hypothetical protein